MFRTEKKQKTGIYTFIDKSLVLLFASNFKSLFPFYPSPEISENLWLFGIFRGDANGTNHINDDDDDDDDDNSNNDDDDDNNNNNNNNNDNNNNNNNNDINNNLFFSSR